MSLAFFYFLKDYFSYFIMVNNPNSIENNASNNYIPSFDFEKNNDNDVSSSENLSASKVSSKTRKYIAKTALGLLAAGGVYALANQPKSTLNEVEKAAPIVGVGAIGSEILWDVGAVMMVAGIGGKIGNPLTVRKRWGEITSNAANSPLTKIGLTVNTIGALSLSGFMVYGGTKVSPALWPGVAGVVTLDIASTIAIRAPIVAAIKSKSSDTKSDESNRETIANPKPVIRTAKLSDIERLAEIDIKLFSRAYGNELPSSDEVREMLTKRYLNNPEWMFVAEINGIIEGFVSAFPTDISKEDFVSWEVSTADGTLDGKVNKDGKYAYITNMTIMSEAVKLGAEEMLLGYLFAKCVSHGVEYGYFVSRIPSFKRWSRRNQIDQENPIALKEAAENYVKLRRRNGKRRDPELSLYESLGYGLERTVQNAFKDEASLNFGVVCRVDNPFKNRFTDIKPIRLAVGGLLSKISNHPKILKKVI